MNLLHTLSDFLDSKTIISPSTPSYYYQGKCPQTGELLKLPRTTLAEAIAQGLMAQLQENNLYSHEGKMYGILIVELVTGEQRVIKAFSGLLNGCSIVDGWVPPIPGREEVALLEAQTLAALENIKQELIHLQQLPERQKYATLTAEFYQELQTIDIHHRHNKQQRQEKRQQLCQTLTGETLSLAIAQLETESQKEGIARRHLKRRQNLVLKPLQELIAAADTKIRDLKQRRKELSRQLQAQMHAAYSLTNFSGQSLSLQELLPAGTPTGTGDCCAPKLLHYAATHQLKPIAMAEFWYGPSSVQDKVQGEFYGACEERCQPLMGFLLSGLQSHYFLKGEESHLRFSPTQESSGNEEIIYEDEWLIAVNKPPGLLSVPGRYHDNQDSVLSRLRLRYGGELMAVHRLDQETSGILLIAKDSFSYSHLSQQFQQRKIHKVYEAILAGNLKVNTGVINLPLWGNPEKRPYQQVDFQYGKPSITQFRVIERVDNYTRVEFIPLTGRTHQLRVHAADQQGLGIVILGDRFYGCNAGVTRLHLHARELTFQHPHSGHKIHLHTKTPF
ncbi:pseudouridine synthase [Richelia sinica FACHB-800]|uniref:RNA pseudouridylate synthase n=1 Tax=Richelia sinica FACHB-800 TaxID=1357546 RepID=A0A975Y676_9NOST|nr:RluA family pseudouridine synthase [Richelia sinica]MBD2664083.1 RluA family pseudouridine synthase [Richelia sinica FACHB-800]QXE24991.1 pseudouridine synthase [Richelia sinica FACHB-800]